MVKIITCSTNFFLKCIFSLALSHTLCDSKRVQNAGNKQQRQQQTGQRKREGAPREARAFTCSLAYSLTHCDAAAEAAATTAARRRHVCACKQFKFVQKGIQIAFIITFHEFALNAKILHYHRLHKNAVNKRRNFCDGPSLSLLCCCRCFTAAALLSLLLFLLLLQFDFGLQLLFGFRLLQLISFAKNQISLSSNTDIHTHTYNTAHTHRLKVAVVCSRNLLNMYVKNWLRDINYKGAFSSAHT